MPQKKSTPKTASVQQEHQPTVVSSDDTAKVLQDIVTAKESSSKIVDENREPLVVCYGIKKRNLIDSLIGTTPGFNQKDTLLSNSKDTTFFFGYAN